MLEEYDFGNARKNPYARETHVTKYSYPAVFTKEDAGYSVTFPDIENCFTSGETPEEAMEMASDALCLILYDKEENGEPIPVASAVNDIPHGENAFVSLVDCDTIVYRGFFTSKAAQDRGKTGCTMQNLHTGDG